MDTIWDYLRCLNTLVAIWCSFRLIRARLLKWEDHTDREKIFWYGLMGAPLTVIVGSVNKIWSNDDGGPQVVMALIIMAFVIWGTYMDDSIDVKFSHRWKV